MDSHTNSSDFASFLPSVNQPEAEKNPLLLVAENKSEDFKSIAVTLERAGVHYRLSRTSNLKLLLATLSQEPDIVFTKGGLAGELITALAERRQDFPIIVIPVSLGDGEAVDGMPDTNVSVVMGTSPQTPRLNHDVDQPRGPERQQIRLRNNAMMRVACRLGRVGAWSLELPSRELIWSDEVRVIHEAPPDFVPSLDQAIGFYSHEYRAAIRTAFEECAHCGVPFDCELQIVTRSGLLLWVRAIGEAERDEHGVIRRVHGAVQDISDRKRDALETEHLAARLTSTLESITDAFFTVDRDWCFTYVNKEAERVFRCSRTELLGRNFWEQFPEARGTPFETQYLRAIKENSPVAFEEFYAPLDVWADVRAYPSVQGLAVYFRDSSQTRRAATMLRESEERYRLLFHAHPHPVWVHDADSHRILAVNETAIERYGYTREDFLSMTTADLRCDTFNGEPIPHLSSQARAHRLKGGRNILVETTSHQLLFEGRRARLVLVQDVTERSKAEQALRESECRFRELAENAQEVFYNTDPRANRILYISPAYELIWGQSCDQLYAAPDSYLDSILPVDRPVVADAQRRTIAGESPEVEYRIHRPDGEVRWIRDRSYPVHDRHGVVERIVGTARDVTENRRATDVLRESEERFRLLIEGVKDYAIILLDPAGNVVSWNIGAERLHGFAASEIIGEHFARFFDSAQAAERMPDRCLSEAAAHGYFQADVQLFRRDCSTFWASIVVTALRNEGGDIRGYSKITRDVSEWKCVNETLLQQAALLDQASDAIIVQGLDQTIRFWSQGAHRLYGWSAEEVIGNPASKFITNGKIGGEQAMAKLKLTGEWSGEIDQVTKSGRPVIVHARWTLLRAAEAVLIINSDVTDKKRTEAHLLRAQRMESIGTLAGGIAHDLNNLLAPIIMGVDLLRRVSLSDNDSRVLGTIERSADRGKKLVRQILSFARGVEGAHVTVDPRYIIQEVQLMIADTFPKNISLSVQIARDIRLLAGDPTQLSQVLLNLCLNSRDSMPLGGRLTIGAHNAVVDAQYAASIPGGIVGTFVAISIADTGSGIPKSVINRIFDPFFTTKEVGKGTGLGLATAAAIMTSHGGFLSVHSEMGKGSLFTVYLPALVEGCLPDSEVSISVEIPRGCGECILFVDDEAPIRAITKQTLENHGYSVFVAEDGIEAITLFVRHQEQIAAVITDLIMPVMDGLALVAAVRRVAPSLPILGASGASDVHQFANVGVSRVIAKPFSAGALLRELNDVLKSRPEAGVVHT